DPFSAAATPPRHADSASARRNCRRFARPWSMTFAEARGHACREAFRIEAMGPQRFIVLPASRKVVDCEVSQRRCLGDAKPREHRSDAYTLPAIGQMIVECEHGATAFDDAP